MEYNEGGYDISALYMDDGYLQKYAHWIAKWATNKPAASNCGMWQFGGETNKIRSNKIQGMTVDQDYMFIDYPSIIKNAKLNGFGVDNTIRDALAALVEKGYNPINQIVGYILSYM